MNYVPDPAAQLQQLQQLQQDVREELAEICQEHEMDSTTKGTWVEFCSGDNCALVAGRLGSLIYMILCDFICNMNLCCTDFIWVYMIQ